MPTAACRSRLVRATGSPSASSPLADGLRRLAAKARAGASTGASIEDRILRVGKGRRPPCRTGQRTWSPTRCRKPSRTVPSSLQPSTKVGPSSGRPALLPVPGSLPGAEVISELADSVSLGVLFVILSWETISQIPHLGQQTPYPIRSGRSADGRGLHRTPAPPGQEELGDYAVWSGDRQEKLGGAARELVEPLREEAPEAQANKDPAQRFVEACRRTRTILPATTTIERLCADALFDAEQRVDL